MKRPEENPAVTLFKKFCEHYNNRNLEGLLSLFCRDHETLSIGTGVDEWLSGLDGIKKQVLRDWSQSEKSRIIPASTFHFSETPTCWTAADCGAEVTIQGQTLSLSHLRGSLVAIQEKGEWKISLMHASFPAANQAEGSSFPNH